MNRHVRCSDCDNPKWVTQKSRRKLQEKFGTKVKIRNRFVCRTCNKMAKDQPFEYQLRYGKPIKILRKKLQKIYLEYRKGHGNISVLEERINHELCNCNLLPENVKYHIDSENHLLGVTVDPVSVMGQTYSIYIPLFTPKEYNKKWEMEKKNK